MQGCSDRRASPAAIALIVAAALVVWPVAGASAQSAATSPALKDAVDLPPRDAADNGAVPPAKDVPAASGEHTTHVAHDRHDWHVAPEGDMSKDGHAASDTPAAPEDGATAPAAPPAPSAAALPAGSGVLDSATVQRIVERLVALHFLGNAADAHDPETLIDALRAFQTSSGISPTGTLDRDTIGRLTTP